MDLAAWAPFIPLGVVLIAGAGSIAAAVLKRPPLWLMLIHLLSSRDKAKATWNLMLFWTKDGPDRSG